MPRSPLAYLADIVDACRAVERFMTGVDLQAYRANEVTRSAVERQLILIGEAVASLLRLEPGLAGQISHARRIVDFRNQLAHDYAAVNDAVVWAITADQVPVLRQECERILAARVASGGAD